MSRSVLMWSVSTLIENHFEYMEKTHLFTATPPA